MPQPGAPASLLPCRLLRLWVSLPPSLPGLGRGGARLFQEPEQVLRAQPCGLEPGKRWDERPCEHCCEATVGRHGGRPGSGAAPALPVGI